MLLGLRLLGLAIPLLTAGACVWQGLRWSTQDADGHQFPKLCLQFKPNLVSLAGGMTSLPVTDPQARLCRALSDLSVMHNRFIA